MQGGLTDLWLDDPYVVAASKLVAMAEEENANGRVFPVRHPAHFPYLAQHDPGVASISAQSICKKTGSHSALLVCGHAGVGNVLGASVIANSDSQH